MTDTSFGPPAELAELFASAEVPLRLAHGAAVRLGPDAATALKDNPWRLLRVPGVRPEQADFFARRLLGADAGPQDPRRVVELAAHLLLRAAGDGHTVTPATSLLSALEAYDPGDAVEALRAAIAAGELVAFMDEAEETELLGLAELAAAEETVAEGLARLTATADPLPPVEGVPAAVFEHGVTLLTGPPPAIERVVRALAGGSAV